MKTLRFGWNEEDVYLVSQRAHALYEQGRFREAAVLFEGLMAVDHANPYLRFALAAVYLSLGEPHAAIDLLNAAVEANPRDPEARARRCEALLESGDLSRAEVDLAALRTTGGAGQLRRLEARLAAARGSLGGTSGSQLRLSGPR